MSSAAVEQWQEFGSLIKSLRQTHGWTLRYVAREIPISSSYQSNIESGQVAPPSDRIIVRMAEVFNIPPTHLLVRAGRLPPSTLTLFWQHPAIPAILSTIPGMSLDEAQMFCQQVVATLRSISSTPIN
jgi:transcriptional regulator with XRE-family HTH domain